MNKSLVRAAFLSLALASSLLPAHTLVQAAGPADCAENDPNCYKLLAPLPLTNPSDAGNADQVTNPSSYVTGIINLAIAVAGVIAVIQIIIGGFQYVVTENFAGKSNAKSLIQNAIIGLLLAIGAFTILQTLNPKLVDLGLTLSPVGKSGPITDPGSCPGSLDADGNCTTTGSSGADANAVGCTNNCVSVQNFHFDHKPPGAGCKGSICYVNQDLGTKLDKLQIALDNPPYQLKWQVSEMFPPTGTHTSGCHAAGPQAGSCVDASLDPSNRNNIELRDFFKAIQENVGYSFQYELPTSAECKQLKDSGVLAPYKNYFVWNSKLQGGPHVHINLSGSPKADISCDTDTGASA